ncbi:MAG: transaldolase [Pirellulales bacterium]|nr:transaldolase [Pirellulales bacterium]
MKANPLQALATFGQSIWFDFIRRGMLTSGELARMIEHDGVSGITSNPAIFEKAINGSQDYDDAIRELATQGKDKLEIYETLAMDDVRLAADLFRNVYDRTGGRDGYVSLEVSPYLAQDADATVGEARRLWAAVDRPNIMIKVPGTLAGLAAIEQLIGEGINVNVTLLFSLERYRQSAAAYLAGLRSRVGRGEPVERVASVASFFLSRIDTAVDPLLEAIVASGGAQAQTAASLLGQVAVASGKVAYRMYGEIFEPTRFADLAAQGAKTQRLLWASTSTKNPDYSDVMYVDPLVGPATVNTLPLETLNAYRDHGSPSARLEQDVAGAQKVLQTLSELGIDLAAVTQQLEDEGIQKFIDPFDRLLASLETHRVAAL